MNLDHITKISAELEIDASRAQAVAALLEQGASVPFIARYRKEKTGSLDEIFIRRIRDLLEKLEELDNRKASILKSLEQNGHLTDELKEAVLAAQGLSTLEDLYLPYRPKRKTRASVAREKGLDPLAQALLLQKGSDPLAAAASFIDPEKGIESVDAALAGARDIVAEIVSEDLQSRTALRSLFAGKGLMKSRVLPGKETEGKKYRDYFEWEEPAASAPSHRVLAMRRGEKEGILSVTIEPPEEEALQQLYDIFVHSDGPDSQQVRLAVDDSYRRLLSRAMETEQRLAAKDKADAEAIRIFAQNLQQLLLAAPLGARCVMAIDPGYRTGCKVACLDRQGKLLHYDTVYIGMSDKASQSAADRLERLCRDFEIEAIAIGNGTGSRETEAFVKQLALPKHVQVTQVNESGASIYSASDIAREEFPDLDITIRGAVSIGRRLMDPLAELVKIDPKSIGVGQYQHDVDQTALKQSLDDVTISCVNSVGVDVNRASEQLLSYVSGIGPQIARNIVAYRNENGPFETREGLKNISRLGPKAFEQSAGFLRIPGGNQPLDASAVHPESYHIVEKMAADLTCSVQDLMASSDLRKRIRLETYETATVGLPTLNDILTELAKPGRDPRDTFEVFAFAGGIHQIEDLSPGMKIPGVVTNVTAFGAFVDIGVHHNGLVHISELADRYVKDPNTIVKVHQKVLVTVKAVDLERKRIALSMKSHPVCETLS